MNSSYRIRISALSLTVACTGSVVLQERVPLLPETEEEAEGTAAHWVAMRYAAGFGHELPVGAKFLSNGREWEVDIDMMLSAVIYTRALGGFHPDLILERQLRAPRIHETECGGTPDARRFIPDARAVFATCPPEFPVDKFNAGRVKVIRIPDFKYGHRFVEVFECYQLVGYANAFMVELNLTDNDEDLYFELILVQPRSYHKEGPVRIWRGHIRDLRAMINRASSAAHEALGDKPICTTNDSCIDCRARAQCVTLQRAEQALVDFSGKPELVELPPEALGSELALVEEAINRLKAREIGLKAQAEALLRKGKAVAYYHMEPSESRLTYKDDVNIPELLGLGDCLDLDLRKPQTLKETIVTPTQAIKLGIDEKIMAKYASRPPGAMKLSRDNSLTVRKVFNK